MRQAVFAVVSICSGFLLASCQGVLDPQGPIAAAERLLLINSTAIMLVVVVPVIVATLAFAWWYRASNSHATRSLDESYEGRVEFVVWSIPALTVILLGGVIWIGSHQLDPRAPMMNSFFVPQLGSQIYAMGGMTTHLNLLADKPGEYPGLSANFSGDGFSWMRFVVKSVPDGDFNAWLEQVRGSGSALNDAGYAELAKPSKAVPPTTYRSVQPKLFE